MFSISLCRYQTYSVTSTDSRGCTATKSFTVSPIIVLPFIDLVCGSNGVTYNSPAEAECAGVTWTRGACGSNATCSICTSPNNEAWCDDFQSYNTVSWNPEGGMLGTQSYCWTTWSGTEGGSEDGLVRRSSDGNQYLRILGLNATGGPQDVVLQLGNKTSGKYKLKFKFLIYPQDKGYYNVLSTFNYGGVNAVREQEVYFDGYGSGRLSVFGTYTNFTYTTTSSGTVWIDIVQDFDFLIWIIAVQL